jgi:hypothetical protein
MMDTFSYMQHVKFEDIDPPGKAANYGVSAWYLAKVDALVLIRTEDRHEL